MESFQDLENLYSNYFGSTTHFEYDDQYNHVLPTIPELVATYVNTNEIPKLDERENDETDVDYNTTGVGIPDSLDALPMQFRNGCGCAENCFTQLTYETVFNTISSLSEMEKNEKELIIMGALKKLGVDKNRCSGTERKREKYAYTFEGLSVCVEAFKVCYDIKERQLRNLTKHVNDFGVVPREHKLKRRRPSNAFKFDVIQNVVLFLTNFANEVGLPQLAPLSGGKNEPSIYLPSDTTKKTLHEKYTKACDESEIQHVGLSLFKDVWLKCVPHIKILSPKEDVCKVCEDKRNKLIICKTEDDKLVAIDDYRSHVTIAQRERDVYNRCIIDAGFGHIKKLYRRSDVDTLGHVRDVVNKAAGCHEAVMYKSQDGWKWRGWKHFLGDRYKKVYEVSIYQYFVFSSEQPGIVVCRESACTSGPQAEAIESRQQICKTHLLDMCGDVLPPEIQPRGLSVARQRYLFNTVRPLIREAYRDITCPEPTMVTTEE